MLKARKSARGLLVILAMAFGSAIPAKAESLFDNFEIVCAKYLHQRDAAAQHLIGQGWKEESFLNFEKFSILGNYFEHGLVEKDARFFVAGNGKSAFVFGRTDNDLNPNNACLLATTERKHRDFLKWSERLFKAHVYDVIQGKRYGNTKMSWKSKNFPQNLSDSLPYAAVELHIGLRPTPFTNARFQASVTGLQP